MRKTLLLAFTAVAAILPVDLLSSPLTPDQALERALSGSPVRLPSGNSRYALAMTATDGDFAGAYVFTRPQQGGFIVVSANDACPALLGFSDSDFADENGNFAPEFEYWINEISRQVKYASGYDGPRRAFTPREMRDPIEPLCSTRWGQTWPYFNLCPEQSGQRCVTGCAATSMAQVMKYHNWPPQGEGKNSYTWNGKTLRMNFENTTFDWENMLDEYYWGMADQTEQTAVATLMKAAGYSINMNYSPNGSGATAPPMGMALINNFRYSKGTRYLERDWFSLYSWEGLIYESLRNNCPVIYNGQSLDGGHSFVCDGYSSDGFFHINWGWNGMSDGYFLLDALDPGEQGTGGSTSAFNYSQQVFINIRPDVDGDSTPYYELTLNGDLTFETKDKTIKMKSMVYNPGPNSIPSGAFGIAVTPVTSFSTATGPTEYIGYSFGESEDEDDTPLQPMYGFRDLDFDLSELPKGRYRLKLFFWGPDEVVREPICDRDATSEYQLAVTEKRVSLTKSAMALPELYDLEFPETFDNESPIVIDGLIANSVNSPREKYLKAAIMSEDLQTLMAETEAVNYELAADATIPLDFSAMLADSSSLVNGEHYMISLSTNDGRGSLLLSEPVRIRYTGSSSAKRIESDPTAERRCFYSLPGVKVAEVAPGEPEPSLPRGVYIVRTPSRCYKIAR